MTQWQGTHCAEMQPVHFSNCLKSRSNLHGYNCKSATIRIFTITVLAMLVQPAPSIDVPINIEIPSGIGSSLRSARVSMCSVDWRRYKKDPPAFPMFRDLAFASGCDSSKTRTVLFGDLEDEYVARKCDTADAGPGCHPSGLVFHQSRCGSTLIANLLAALPSAVTYSESKAPLDILSSISFDEDIKIKALRVLVSAMGRPLARAGAAQVSLSGDSTDGEVAAALGAVDGDEWTPTAMFFKLQSVQSMHMHVWRKAFPRVPWLFVQRDGAEVLASLFRGQSAAPLPDASSTASIGGTVGSIPNSLRSVPCLRTASLAGSGGEVGEVLARVGGLEAPDKLHELTPEAYCAIQTAAYAASALNEGISARADALAVLGVDASIAASSVWSLPAFRAAAGEGTSACSDAFLGVVAGIGQGLPLDYTSLPASAFTAIRCHFGQSIPSALLTVLERVAGKYSKARSEDGAEAGQGNKPGSKRLGQPAQPRGGGWAGPDRTTTVYKDDSEDKQAAAWPLLQSVARTYMRPFRTALQAFADDLASGSGSLDGPDAEAMSGAYKSLLSSHNASDRSPHAKTWRDLQLPLGEGYPALFPLADLLTAWSADIVTPPPDYGRFSSLRVFDWSLATDRDAAEAYRRAEVPFIVRNVQSLDATVRHWANDADLLEDLGGPDKAFTAELNSAGNHFMYWNKAHARQAKGYTPPTREGHVKAGDWLAKAYEVSAQVVEEERRQLPAWWFAGKQRQDGAVQLAVLAEAQLPPLPPYRATRELWYMRASTDQMNANAWIHKRLTFVSPDGSAGSSDPDRPFFLVDSKQQRGIHCRFGMPGIIAEAHYDGGRNFITMQKGRKRYVLAPPSECGNLGLLKDGPSARHSALDWSDPSTWPDAGDGSLASALGLEVIIEAGDALYVPALWFHYIVSLEANIQCNTRSGTPPLHHDVLAACGFKAPSTEPIGEHTDLKAAELQPDRNKHMDAWQKLWPAESTVGSLGAANVHRLTERRVSSYAQQVKLAVSARDILAGTMDGSIGTSADASGTLSLQRIVASALRFLIRKYGEKHVEVLKVLESASEGSEPVVEPEHSGIIVGESINGRTGAHAVGASNSVMTSSRARSEALVSSMRETAMWVAITCAVLTLIMVFRALGRCNCVDGATGVLRRTLCCCCCCRGSSRVFSPTSKSKQLLEVAPRTERKLVATARKAED